MSAAPLDIPTALDPACSCVIEACAGSGKTWLLVARMLRALLAGAKPAEILALTFTRKAAQEMRARLDALLMDLATLDEAAAISLLAGRGLSPHEARRQLPRARRLCEEMLAATPPLAIDTFHGWFIGLAQRAPMGVQDEAGTLGASLDDAAERLFEEAWQRFALRCGRAPASPEGLAFQRLLGEHGLHQTRALLVRWQARSVEWQAFTAGQLDPAAWAIAQLAAETGAGDIDARAHFVAQHRHELDTILLSLPEFDKRLVNWGADAFMAHLQLMQWEAAAAAATANTASAASTASPTSTASTASTATPGKASGAARSSLLDALFDGAGKILFKNDGAARASQPTKTAINAWGSEAAHGFAERLAALAAPWQAARESYRAACTLALNADVFACGTALQQELDAFKRESRRIAFNDIEALARRLLTDSNIAAYLHERLDARIRHVLIDEFQDTNPVQWQALQGWFDAYGDDTSRPSVFIVGDPKQSIYRFRRADARLFDAAGEWLATHYGARRFEQNQTRRNAPAVVALVNTLFRAVQQHVPGYTHFHEHSAFDSAKPGRVELLPLAEYVKRPKREGPLRNPLLEAAPDDDDQRAFAEGAQVAERIRQLLAQEVVRADGAPRPLRAADILLLARRRRDFAAYEMALREAGIPFITARAGGLLDALEARDLAALLNLLMTPARDLWLAHVLKSPLMGATDEDLMTLAALARDRRDARGKGSEGVAFGEASAASDGHGAAANNATAGWWPALMHSTALPATLARARDLLAAWQSLAGVLPVHDLLDRILADADARTRYAAAVPLHQRAQVLANLDAFIELALNVDSGRFPSLPRFLDELRRMAQGAEQEAPDEGTAAREDALRLMTIHAAKGLEAPVVFLLGTNAGVRADTGFRDLVVWPPDAPAPSHFSMLGKLAEAPLVQQEQLQAESALDQIENFNVLYVALTRAQQIVVVSGAPSERAPADAPYALVADALKALGDAAVGPMPLEEALLERLSGMPPVSVADGVTVVARATAAAVPPTGQLRETESDAMRAGTHLHLAMQALSDARDARAAPLDAAVLAARLGVDVSEAQALHDAASAVCVAPSLSRFFDPEQFVRARNEMTYADAQGEVRRVDRVVEFHDAVWVLDYKTQVSDQAGDARRATYVAQVAAYVAALQGLTPDKPVRGALIDLAARRLIAL